MLAYGDGTGIFSIGLMKWKHVYEHIEGHKVTLFHRHNVETHIMTKNSVSVDSLIKYGLSLVRKNQIKNNRLVLFRIIEIVKLTAKRGLIY
jgi:hypothetical protein